MSQEYSPSLRRGFEDRVAGRAANIAEINLNHKMADRKYWFRKRKYGAGLTPATWQGWLLLIVFVLLFLSIPHLNGNLNYPANRTKIIVEIVILVAAFIGVVCWKGEKPIQWRWGKKTPE